MSPLVALRTASDGVRLVGPDPIAPAGFVFLCFDGVTAVIDPVGDTPQLLVHDAGAAAELVADVFGDAVAEELDSADEVSVEAAGTDGAAALHRAGVLNWLNDIRPLPLDPELIALECAVSSAELPWAVSQPRGTTGDQAAVVDQMVHLLRSLRMDDHGALHRSLEDLARRALPHLPVGNHGLWPELAQERALLRAAGSTPTPPTESTAPGWLHDFLVPRSAAHLGTTAQSAASLDWPRVPRRLVPAPEESVVFWVEPAAGGAGRLIATIAASPPPRLHPALLHPAPDPTGPTVSVAAPGWPLPLATGPLTLQPDGLAWVGDIAITSDAMRVVGQADALDLDVRSAHLPWRPPDPVRDAKAMARRWAARGVAGLRLASAVSDPGWARMARDGLTYAARLWRGLDAASSDRCLRLAERGLDPAPLSVAEAWLLESDTGR